MNLGELIAALVQTANENPALLTRPVFVDDGDEILGAVHRVEPAYSSREDDISGEKVLPGDSRDKYLVTTLIG